jgi:Rps23 Pro-64 3,4-dihydroxylase Tpa1-like proline 4-hydroxylase
MTQPNIINNFISKKTAKFLNDYLKTKVEIHEPDSGHPNGVNRFPIYFKGKSVFFDQIKIKKEDKIVFDLLNLIGQSISNKFNLPKNNISLRGMTYTIYNTGQGLPAHDDWKVSKFEVYSAILYLNDDYEGGDIIFYDFWDQLNPKFSKFKKYHPKCGQLFYFNGNHDTIHEVENVISGKRSCIILFYAGDVIKEGVKEFDGTWGKS